MKLIQVMKNNPKCKFEENKLNHDIIVFVPTEKIEHKDNKTTIVTELKKDNLTKRVQATSKLIKANSLEEKMTELKNILNK